MFTFAHVSSSFHFFHFHPLLVLVKPATAPGVGLLEGTDLDNGLCAFWVTGSRQFPVAASRGKSQVQKAGSKLLPPASPLASSEFGF